MRALLLALALLLAAGPACAALPTFVACGTAVSTTGSTTWGLPAGIQANDILLLFAETRRQAVTFSNEAGGTWTAVTGSPVDAATGSTATETRLTVFWSRYNGTQTAPSTNDPGTHQGGAICAWRGVRASGDPWNVTSTSFDLTVDTSGDLTGATTTAADSLVVIVGTAGDDSGVPITTVTNADLASISAARVNVAITVGNEGGLTVFDGQKATAGSYGTTALTYTGAVAKAMMTIALEGAVAAAGGLPPGALCLVGLC